MKIHSLGSISLALTAVAALLAAGGCDAYTLQYNSYDDWGYEAEWDPSIDGEPLEMGLGEIKGDFGESTLTAYRPADVIGWHASGYWGMDVSTVEVETVGDHGWTSMALLEVYGGLGADELAPGTRKTFHIEDESTNVFIVATGCSGLDPNEWTHDEIAETIDIEVDPVVSEDGMHTVHFTATFVLNNWLSPNYSPQTSTLSGSFQAKPVTPTAY